MNNQKDQYSINDKAGQVLEKRILERAGRFTVPQGRSREEALEMLKRNPAFLKSGITPAGNTKMRLIYASVSIAASILLLVGIWRLFLFTPETQLSASRGETKEITLPDGSNVSINSESTLTFDEKNFTGDRHIRLDGEGFFRVKKGSTFTVSTKDADITVLGTSFNIYSREDGFKVSCIEGKVSVSNNEASVIIGPGESALIGKNGLYSFSDTRISNSTGWLNGEFYYENSPLSSVFSEVERQFNIMFAVRITDEMHFTGSFGNKELKAALESICIPMGLDYEIRDNKIFISKNTGR